MKIPKSFFVFSFFLSIITSSFWENALYAESVNIIIKITGTNERIEKNILAHLHLAQEHDIPLTEEQIQQLHILAQQDILLAIQPFGYYTPAIISNLDKIDDKWIASYEISLGKPTIIASLDLKLDGEGHTDPRIIDVFSTFPLKIGDLCEHEPYEKNKKSILTQVIHAGYLKAIYQRREMQVDIDMHQCHIILHLDTKQQYHLSTVTFSDSKLDNSFLNRFIPFQPGNPYTPDKVLTLQRNLEQSDYFKTITLEGALNPSSPIVPIYVKIEDIKANNYLFGIGYGTDTGARGKIGWERRRVNRWGHRFLADLQLAERSNRLEAKYNIPGKHPNTDTIEFLGRFIEDEFNEKKDRIHEISISETRNIYNWQRIMALTYKNERFQQFESIDKEHSSLLLPSLRMVHITSDDPSNPTHGKRITLSLLGAWDVLLSDTSFIQADIQYKWIHKAGHHGQWILRTELGMTIPDNIKKLPLSQRFYAGGDESIRGFSYRSLPSEINEEGKLHPVGGAYLGIVSLEYIYKITRTLGISLFTDVGNAFTNIHDEIQAGAGIGLRWKTPIGPLRIEVAQPLTNAAHALRLHVGFGPDL